MPVHVCLVTQLYLTLCHSMMPTVQLNLLHVLSLSSTFPKKRVKYFEICTWKLSEGIFSLDFGFLPLSPGEAWGSSMWKPTTWKAHLVSSRLCRRPGPLQCIWSPTPWFPTLLWSWVLLFHVLRVSCSLSSKLCFTSLRQSRVHSDLLRLYVSWS